MTENNTTIETTANEIATIGITRQIITDEMRALVVQKFSDGLTNPRIATELMMNKKAVASIIRLYTQTGDY